MKKRSSDDIAKRLAKRVAVLGVAVQKLDLPPLRGGLLNPDGNDMREYLQQRVLKTPNGCIEWGLGTDRQGYGQVTINYQWWRAHRLSYYLFCGDIPKGLGVLHSCDNPRCIKPDHLFLGTEKDNAHDAMRKGRHSKGEKVGTAKLTIEKVSEIRSSYRSRFSKDKASGLSVGQLARAFSVGATTIYRVINGDTWKNDLVSIERASNA